MASTILSSCAKLAGPGELRYHSRQTEKSGYNRYKFGAFIYSEVPAYRDRTANNRKCICGDGRRDVCEQSETSTGFHLQARPELAAPPSSFPGTRRAHRMKPAIQPRWRQGLLGRHSVHVQHRTALPLKRTELLPRPRPARAAGRCVALSFPQGSARVCCRRCATASSSNPEAGPATSRASRCRPRRRAVHRRSSRPGRSAR